MKKMLRNGEGLLARRRGTSCAIPYETSMIKFAPHVQIIGYKIYIIKIEKKTIDHKKSISKYEVKSKNAPSCFGVFFQPKRAFFRPDKSSPYIS